MKNPFKCLYKKDIVLDVDDENRDFIVSFPINDGIYNATIIDAYTKWTNYNLQHQYLFVLWRIDDKPYLGRIVHHHVTSNDLDRGKMYQNLAGEPVLTFKSLINVQAKLVIDVEGKIVNIVKEA